MFTSKRLERANIAIIFQEQGFSAPDNAAFAALYAGEQAKGMRFVEDAIMRTSLLAVPALNLTLVLEGTRLRVDDDSGQESQMAALAGHISQAAATLLSRAVPDSYGFNFDTTYRFGNAIPTDVIFGAFTTPEIFRERDLRNLGVQFTMERKGQTESYFVKVVNPLEIAIHVNVHVPSGRLPAPGALQQQLQEAYAGMDDVVNALKF